MNRRQASLALAVGAGAAGLGVLGAATGAATGAPARQSVLIGGAGAMLALNQAWARAFRLTEPATDMVIDTGGSLPAYIAASRAAIDLAAMTRSLTEAEDTPEAHQFLVAKDALSIVVHASSVLTSLPCRQVRALFTGEADNWRQLDGPAQAVQVYAPPRASVARSFAEEFLLDGADFTPGAGEPGADAAVLAALAADPAGVACVAARSALPPGVVRLRVEQVPLTPATILSGRYPYTHAFYLMLYGAREGARARFLDFARSPAGQAIVSAHGMHAVC